ncbi:hypothetical protein D3C77_528980 [compost metagenome]
MVQGKAGHSQPVQGVCRAGWFYHRRAGTRSGCRSQSPTQFAHQPEQATDRSWSFRPQCVPAPGACWRRAGASHSSSHPHWRRGCSQRTVRRAGQARIAIAPGERSGAPGSHRERPGRSCSTSRPNRRWSGSQRAARHPGQNWQAAWQHRCHGHGRRHHLDARCGGRQSPTYQCRPSRKLRQQRSVPHQHPSARWHGPDGDRTRRWRRARP